MHVDSILGKFTAQMIYSGFPSSVVLCHSLQVSLYFYNKLYRGNRVTKVDTGSFNAFTSPNLAPLAICEVDITSTARFSKLTPLTSSNGSCFNFDA